MELSREEAVQEIKKRVDAAQDDIIQFLRDIVAIPSMNGELKEVGERIAAEMNKLGFDEVRFDKMGNIMGRIGNGEKVIVYDSHIDTVGIGDPDNWEWDPFIGKVEDGVLFARGAVDEKGSTPGMVYGLSFARDLGLLDGITAWYFGNMEEWCDGIAPNTFVEVDPGIRPDFVVIGEPTKMQVYRGHKGRIELKITASGKSAHAATHYLGDNAVYKMAAVITHIRELDRRLRLGLGSHPLQGNPTVAVTDLKVTTGSLNAVPNEFSIYLDRRITSNEPHDDVIAQIKGLIPDYLQDEIKVEELFYDEPSYTGFKFPVSKYYPAWLQADDHPMTQAGQNTIKTLWGEERELDTWDFSTNGTYWAGKAGIPSIGFGPGDEKFAHRGMEQVPLKEVVDATEFYALFPNMLLEKMQEG
ncbi:MAG: YgeY family selenium metabolism-linked hydrolase [Anaerolineae bacterium]|jgi:putative selenium metabolism hydrolase|nr:YgeY family selenium metabolism-linked hydrolase [Anaerolineae bacterium]MBT7190539.1 YgeY family selenium metabolism-linked hydrolase [Anaerolineae bacterium]MBT7989607.1 YgeY family selenium metabolism-linked hydrolase [Anaerolineae bacterium]